MRTRAAVTGVSAVIAVTGIAVMAVAWAVGNVSWLFADLPEADNDIVRELTLAAIGAVFVVAGLIGAGVGRAARATGRVSAGALAAAGLLAASCLLVAVVGASRVAAQSAAAAVTPALDGADLLNVPSGDGRVVLLVALVLGATAVSSLLAGSRTAAAVEGQEPAVAGR